MAVDPNTFSDLTGLILNAAIEVHRTLGAGLLESAYLPALKFELTTRNLRYSSQRAMPIVYKGTTLDTVYRVDLVVQDTVSATPVSSISSVSVPSVPSSRH